MGILVAGLALNTAVAAEKPESVTTHNTYTSADDGVRDKVKHKVDKYKNKDKRGKHDKHKLKHGKKHCKNI